MCILFIAVNQHKNYPLIITANRDEYFLRPSQSMHDWADLPGVLAGRDLLKGGSWLGTNEAGAFCAVTNFRTTMPVDELALSRGELISRYLGRRDPSDDAPSHHNEFVQYLTTNHHRYSPFNLIFGNREQLWTFTSNGSGAGKYALLTDGFHSVSNGEIEQPWPKMSLGVNQLTKLITQTPNNVSFGELNELMKDQTPAPQNQLPDTGLGAKRERALSSIFVSGEQYGTRTTTLLLFSASGIDIQETNYRPNGQVDNQTTFNRLT